MNPVPTLLVAACLLGWTRLAAAAPAEIPRDWRHDLLEEERIGLSPDELTKARKRLVPTIVDLQKAYPKLSSENFAEREQAQRDLLRGGETTLKWLTTQGRAPDPEVRRRVAEILATIRTGDREARTIAVQHALASLLDEGDERRADTGGLFYEWFGESCPKIAKGYRQFVFENTAQRTGQVKDGCLQFPGAAGLDGDQRLVLEASSWPGGKEFGGQFEVSARLGGEDLMPVAWHLGISVGNVRALYHPGLRGGEFRFEEVDTNGALTQNTAVGFNPSTEHLQSMYIKVRRLDDQRVRLDVTLREGGGKEGRFDKSITLRPDQIGSLDRISLDRSGRSGGTARFEDLMVRLTPGR